MLVFGQKLMYSCKVVEILQSDCILAKVVVIGPKFCFVIGQGCCIRAKVVVFGQRGCIRANFDVFLQKWLYSGIVIFFEQKLFHSGKRVVFGQKWLY